MTASSIVNSRIKGRIRVARAICLGVFFVLALAPIGCGSDDGRQRPLSTLERKAKRIEKGLARHPGDARLLLASMRAWTAAGYDRLNKLGVSGRPVPAAVAEDFRAGVKGWKPYLAQTGGEASVDVAETAGGAFFALAEIGTTNLDELETDVAEAARALRIAGRHRHNLYTLSNVAIYAFFNAEFAYGDRFARTAEGTVSKKILKPVVTQFAEYRERAENFRGQLRRARAELRESGEDRLERPLRMYASSTGINDEDPS